MNLLESLFRRRPPAIDDARRGHQAEQLLASLLALAWVVEARDPYTGGHLWRVSRYCALLCEHIGLSPQESARISLGGFLHDLGKVAVPDAVLRKPGPLTSEEYEVIKTHPEVGARLLAGHPLAVLVLDAVHLHHETPDGKGYPRSLRGDEIPLAARVVGLCDAFDAMTSARPYRKPMSVEQAVSNLEAGAGAQFDGALASSFIALARDGVLHHIAGHCDDGIPLQACLVCGPTLVVRREQRPGERVFCRNCGREHVLEAGPSGAPPIAVPTGTIGSARDLEPQPDQALIERLVHDSARHDVGALSLLQRDVLATAATRRPRG